MSPCSSIQRAVRIRDGPALIMSENKVTDAASSFWCDIRWYSNVKVRFEMLSMLNGLNVV